MKTPKNDVELIALELFERALKRPKAERSSFVEKETGENNELRQRVEALLRLDAQSGSKILTGQAVFNAAEDDLSNTEIGSYRIIELIGKGGMGAVYKAERKTGDFAHNVAIKVIRPGVLSEPLVERFERERQTLADFSHPNIARLYDGGTTEDDAPYIIMEYVDGLPITDFAKTNKLNEADCLNLFENACDAIGHAHQNLIVHRDITPNNVLVTREGDVKVIDFGIAKAMDESLLSESVDNSLASLSFTPGFAAPERSKGSAANTLADVYSLGKLLETLLADIGVSKELTAIIAKATQPNPRDRYTSVEALKDDVTYYQTDFPVQAAPQNTAYRLKKFIQRNTAATVLSTFAAIALIGGLLTTSILYNKAETERAHADARFNETRDLANFMMFDLFDGLVDIDGTTSLQESVAAKSKIYLETLSKTPRSTSQLQFELAQGLHRLATISGGPDKNIGQPTSATALYTQSMDEFNRLLADYEADPNFMDAYLEAMDDYGFFAFMALDDGKLTSEITEDFDVVIQRMISEYPEKLTYRMRRVGMLRLRGENFGWLSEFDAGRRTLEKALQIAKEAEDKFGTDPDIQARTARIYKAYSELEHKAGLQDLGDQQLAVNYADQGIKLLHSIENDIDVSQQRENEENLFYLNYSKTVAYQAMPDYQKSAETALQALEIINRLVSLNPDNFSFKRNKYYLENALSQTYVELGDNSEAQRASEMAMSSVAKALDADKDSPMILTDYGTILGESAMVFERTGDRIKSCELVTTSLKVFEKLTERQQINAYHQDIIIPKLKTTQTGVCS